ncbi:MAG: hypothetical protein ACI8XO_001637 [Verrucomicrobiales bacterium]|jgi:hypothetical protein
MTRRDALRLSAAGLSLPGIFAMQASARAAGLDTAGVRSFGKAKRCIVMFAWGGMSHIDTWDLKPEAGSDVRSAFGSIPTTIPGYHVCEHLPRLAKHAHELTIIRSAHHNASSHRSAAYWNLTGHAPKDPGKNWTASRKDWPCIGSMVAHATDQGLGPQQPPNAPSLPGTVCLPYTMYDGGTANGQDGGFLGLGYDPAVIKPKRGTPYDGKSPSSGIVSLDPIAGIDRSRIVSRRGLLDALEARGIGGRDSTAEVEQYRTQALDMLLDPKVRAAFDVDNESRAMHELYGSHICGQSTLMARKLVEAGVPLATVYCSAGDLNGSKGAHWDTHGDGFNRLKRDLLPPLDQAFSALLTDLKQRGLFDDTLVVLLTEFGRTPKISNGGGRDHYPNCYTVAYAGAGVSQGLLYGSSDKTGAFPASQPVSPPDLHATIFHALGIDPNFTLHDQENRPLAASDGKVLPIFA